MNKPDFSVQFSVNKTHGDCHFKYIVYLEDLNLGNMSLTNGIEIAIKQTIEKLKVRIDEVDLYSKTFWFYKDSEGEYAHVLFPGARAQFLYLPPERAEKILALMDLKEFALR